MSPSPQFHLRSISRWLPPPKAEKWLVHAVVVCVAALFLAQAFIWMQDRLPSNRANGFVSMVDGAADKPFIYRQLVPQMIKLVDVSLSEQQQKNVAKLSKSIYRSYASVANIGHKKQAKILKKGNRFFRIRLIHGVIMLVFLILYGAVMYHLAARLFPQFSAAPFASLILSYAVLPIGSWPPTFLYDAATLCLTALCFYAVLTSRYKLYIVCFTLACINKETAIYILIMYALCAGKSSKELHLLLLQMLIFLAVFIFTHLFYQQNPGSPIEIHGVYYIEKAIKGVGYLKLAVISWIVVLLCYQWQSKPLLLRRTLWIVALAIPVWMVFGRAGELRALYEIHPYMVLLATHSIIAMTQLHKARLFRHV